MYRTYCRKQGITDEVRLPSFCTLSPFETVYFKMMDREVWSYRYMESNIYHMIFNFYFDPQGVLRRTQKKPDPQFDPSQRNMF